MASNIWRRQRNNLSLGFPVELVDAADPARALTGMAATTTVTRSTNGASYVAAGGTLAEIGATGDYWYTPGSGDFATLGAETYRFVEASEQIVPGLVRVSVETDDPNAAGALGASERNAIADALLDRADAIETGMTLRRWLRAIRAEMFGKAAISAGTVVFKRADGTTTALSIQYDGIGNRPVVTIGDLD